MNLWPTLICVLCPLVIDLQPQAHVYDPIIIIYVSNMNVVLSNLKDGENHRSVICNQRSFKVTRGTTAKIY